MAALGGNLTWLGYRWQMIILLAGALYMVEPSPTTRSRPHCSLQRLMACKNTNQLIWDSAFRRQLKLFAGRSQSNALGIGSGPLAESLFDTLGGPPDKPVELSDGNLLFTACVAHNCTEKGAIVLSPSGNILAAAMLTNHFVHEGDAKWTMQDDGYSRLDFFVRAPIAGQPAWYAAIADWAKLAYQDDRKVFDQYWRSSGLTESIWLIRSRSSALRRLATRKIYEDQASKPPML